MEVGGKSLEISLLATNLQQALSLQVYWVNGLIDSISYIKEDNENISKQILYMNVISMMCRDDDGAGLY